jgi:hypothetical protein
VCGRELGKDAAVFGDLGKGLVAHGVNLAAHDNRAGFQTHHAADPGGHDLVVAGQDLHGDALVGERRKGLSRAVLGWIEKGDEAR